MSQLIRKLFNATFVKAAAPRTWDAVLSTQRQDRDADRISLLDWMWAAIVPLLWAHSHTELPIGRVRNLRVERDALRGVVEFPPEGTYAFADQVVRLIEAGFLGSVSVGFRAIDQPTPNALGGVDFVGKKELLELSVVNVPANEDAQIERMDGVALMKWFGGSRHTDDLIALSDVSGSDDEVLLEVDDAEPVLELADDPASRRLIAETRAAIARDQMDPARRAGLIDVDLLHVNALAERIATRALATVFAPSAIRKDVRRAFAQLRGRLD